MAVEGKSDERGDEGQNLESGLYLQIVGLRERGVHQICINL